MADSPKTLLALWPSQEALASDIGATVSAIRKWAQRGSIPAEYWAAMVGAACGRAIPGVTLEALAAMHARRPVFGDLEAEART
jgi:hypothetical protein